LQPYHPDTEQLRTCFAMSSVKVLRHNWLLALLGMSLSTSLRHRVRKGALFEWDIAKLLKERLGSLLMIVDRLVGLAGGASTGADEHYGLRH
jgi:hypothetical protein